MQKTQHQLTKLAVLAALCLSLPQPGLAAAKTQLDSNTETRLARYETMVFGIPQTSQSAEKRMQKLEKAILGKTGSGNFDDRLLVVEKIFNGRVNLEMYPPAAPTLDRSEFAAEPKQAPSLLAPYDMERPAAASTEDTVKSLLAQALSAHSKGDLASAERILQKALAQDFRNPDVNFNLGAVYEQKGQPETALKYYRNALSISPDDPEYKEAVATLQKQVANNQVSKSTAGQGPQVAPAPALDTYRKQQLKLLADQAAADYKQGRFDEAIAKLDQILRQEPLDANVQFALGQAWRGKGQSYQALRHLRAANTLDPKNELYRKTLAEAERETNTAAGTPALASAQEDKPAGQLTPFSNDGFSPRADSFARQTDLSSLAGLLGFNSGGSNLGMGNNMLGLSGGYGTTGFSPYMGRAGMVGYDTQYYSGANSTRMRRLIQSSLAGAAMGAMMNRGLPGGMSSGALRGAMYGGFYGLMSGGL